MGVEARIPKETESSTVCFVKHEKAKSGECLI